MSIPLAAIFDRAADIVARGWTQDSGPAVDFAGRDLLRVTDPAACRWCMVGAIDLAVIELGLGETDAYERACAHFGGDLAVIRFNDASGRTQGEVVDALRAAARTHA